MTTEIKPVVIEAFRLGELYRIREHAVVDYSTKQGAAAPTDLTEPGMPTLFKRYDPPGIISVDEIAFIGKPLAHKGGWRCIVTYKNGETDDWSEGEIERLLRHPDAIMTAEPGTFLGEVDLESSGANDVISKVPVIAWAKCFDGELRPMTAAGVAEEDTEFREGFVILDPSGQVILTGPEGKSFPSLDEFVAEMLDEQRRAL